MGLRGNPCLQLSIYKNYVGHGRVCEWARRRCIVGGHRNYIPFQSLYIFVCLCFSWKYLFYWHLSDVCVCVCVERNRVHLCTKSNKSLSFFTCPKLQWMPHFLLMPKTFEMTIPSGDTNRIFPTCFFSSFAWANTLYLTSINQFRMVCSGVYVLCTFNSSAIIIFYEINIFNASTQRQGRVRVSVTETKR